MATYSTDLTTLSTAESGTWAELTGTILGFTLSGGGSPGTDAENFIQGTGCYSQTTGKATDAEISMVFDFGSNRTFTAGHVVFGWCYYAVGANLKTKANSGWMFVIADSLTTGDYFVIGGSDYGRNPYGGWTNVAIDPTATQSGTLGGGANSGNYRYFGQVCNTIGEITKGNPSAVDAIRAGRGEISVTGSGGSFSELASYNDYNAGSTPPGTSSTSKDSGRHRLGLFQESGGTYLWKGLLALGLTGTSVTFSDSNETIIIDDCPFTYAAFNKIEVRNASSTVTLTNITILSTATTANGVGYFEMVANATVTLSGCSFNDMGTFIFQSNGTVTDSNFNGCGQITAGSATFTGCAINSSTSATSLLAGNNDMTDITGNSFVSDGSNHAVEINAVGTGSMTWNNTLTSYVAGTSGNNVTTGSTGNEAIYLNFTSAATYTINVSAGATVPSVRKGAGMTGNVNIVAGAVSITVNTVTAAGDSVETRVFIETATGGGGGSLPFEDSVSIARVTTTATVTHTAHGLSSGDKVVIRGAEQNEYVGIKTISNVTTNTYDFTVSGTPTTPATGTIVSSFVFISGTTTSGSITSTARTLSVDQPVKGTARKSTATPYYKAAPIVGTIDTADGLNVTAVMIIDE